MELYILLYLLALINSTLLSLFYYLNLKQESGYVYKVSINIQETKFGLNRSFIKNDIKHEVPLILIWNNKCVNGSLLQELDRGFPGYTNLSPNFKYPFNFIFTRRILLWNKNKTSLTVEKDSVLLNKTIFYTPSTMMQENN